MSLTITMNITKNKFNQTNTQTQNPKAYLDAFDEQYHK